MKDKVFGVLQRIGRSFMLPIAVLPVAGLLLGIGGSFTNETMLRTYGLINLMGPGTWIYSVLLVMRDAGQIVFDNLPILFAMGVAIGMAKKEKEVAALAAAISFFVMHAAISAMIQINGGTENLLAGAFGDVVGITSLQMGVFGGIIVGLGVAALHNRFFRIELPQVLSFFGGTRFVPIICALTYTLVGILMYFIWPPVQNVITAIGGLVLGSGYVGTWIYGFTERALIPFGLHHVFYIPFWQTAVGGSMEIAGNLVEGAQNIFFAQLADSSVEQFAVSATRFMSGKFPLMIFGLPGAALAMYTTADSDKKDRVFGLLLSAALTSMITGITEPLEFTFLFVAPLLYVIHCVFAGFAYMLMHVFQVGVGMTFSGGLIDLFLFGILQGNAKTNWLLVPVVGIGYFAVYYVLFSFLIKKLNLKTPGRGETEDVKLYTRADVAEQKEGLRKEAFGKEGTETGNQSDAEIPDVISINLCNGLGGKKNISDVDCCATRLRCTVYDAARVNDDLLKSTGASGVIHKGNGVQIIFGPKVTVIKSNLDDYLEKAPDQYFNMTSEKSFGTTEKEVTLENIQNLSRQPEGKIRIDSPIRGLAAGIEKAPDQAFSQKLMGDGMVIYPSGSCVVAPFDGTVEMVFETKHAIGLRSEEGVELLIHVGIDTVKFGGRGFETLVSDGDKIKKGQTLLNFDRNHVRANAVSDATPVIVTNMQENWKINVLKTGNVKELEELFEIEVS